MEPKWFILGSYLCTECNTSREVQEILGEDIDESTQMPYGIIKLRCGHTEKLFRVSKEVNIAPLFRKSRVSVEPHTQKGIPYLTVSGAGSTYVADSITIDQSNNVFNIYTNTNQSFNANTSIDASSSTTLQNIFIQIDNRTYSPDQKAMIKEIVNAVNKDGNTKPLPQIYSSLSDKAKTCISLATPFIVPILTKFLNPN